MKAINLLWIIGSVGLTSVIFSFCHGNTTGMKEIPDQQKGFAVVELFTSEGCSSCPAADETIIRLSKEFTERVYFLCYHVDYWDYTGWKDEFANAKFTDRQEKYAGMLGVQSIYTPQAVVNGERELVGSRENRLRELINEDLKNEKAPVIELSAKENKPGNIAVSCHAPFNEGLLLNIALVQRSAATNVKRGENSGRKLNHCNIVRDLETIELKTDGTCHLDFKIPSGLKAEDMEVISFLQDKKNLKMIGASRIGIAK